MYFKSYLFLIKKLSFRSKDDSIQLFPHKKKILCVFFNCMCSIRQCYTVENDNRLELIQKNNFFSS